VKVDISLDKTQRGNPKHYIFTLECGHTRTEFHGPYSFVRAAAFALLMKEGKESDLKMHCYDCAAGRKPSPKCEKTQLPLGIVTLKACETCSSEQLRKCAKAYEQWKS